jgi:hypothetical protein
MSVAGSCYQLAITSPLTLCNAAWPQRKVGAYVPAVGNVGAPPQLATAMTAATRMLCNGLRHTRDWHRYRLAHFNRAPLVLRRHSAALQQLPNYLCAP